MEKIDAKSPESTSTDLVAKNIAALKALFPELLSERIVDGQTTATINVDVLKGLVGDATVTEVDEKYGLNWHGKRRARQLALTPSTGTLRPCPEESVDWDTTQNLMIEGDNLEVLKLLQRSYAGKVKLIYIDPPYNTGKDFVYPDNFQDNIKNYLELTAQVEGGSKVASNAETSGRFHTEWLNLIYPRLRLAHSLLRRDGVIFISVDDVEVANLKKVCDEIFGEENFVAQLVWEGAFKNDARQIGVNHEYVLVFARSRALLPKEWAVAKDGVAPVLKEVARLKQEYGDDYDAISSDLAAWFRASKATTSFAHRRFRYVDKIGAYKEDDPTAPGGRKFDLRNPRTAQIIPLRTNRGWSFDQSKFDELVSEGRVSFITDTSVMVRRYLHETDSLTPQSVVYQPARSASERLDRVMGAMVFDFPKDEVVLAQFIEMGTAADDDDCVVLDFFAGSGTTAHAVHIQNARDSGRRKYILVQLPEPLRLDVIEQRESARFCDVLKRPRNIAELTKERLRRSAVQMRADSPMFSGDTGFRVFKLDSSNIRAWNPNRDDLAGSLLDNLEHIQSGRTDDDLLFEILLKLGLDLCVPMERRSVARAPSPAKPTNGKNAESTFTVHSIGGGVLMACLDPRITAADAEPLALGIVEWHKSIAPAGATTCIFRDSAFENDVAKSNLAAILEQHGIKQVRSL